jgi:ABC transport system ATP-binding/permease protein
MNHLSVEKLTKSYSDKVLFENISLGIDEGSKVALVGANGTGKSTLLKILMKFEFPDDGNFNFNKSIKVGFLKQEPDVHNHDQIMDYVLAGDELVIKTVRAYYHFIEEHSSDEMDATLLDKMTELNAWDFESKAKQVLGKLGIHNLSQPVDELSGGQKKRVALARLLLEEPDMLILDEPTNHLDLEAIEWLEDYLSKLKVSLLLVTHDRYFLQAVTNQIIELENGNLYKYTGNYTQFLEKRIERKQVEQDQADKAKNLLKKEVEWLNRQPQARTTKAKYRIDAVDGIRKVANQVKSKSKLEINLTGKRLGKKILEIENLTKQFDGQFMVDSFSYTFRPGDRIGFVGKNGVGKSSFLNLITDQIPVDSGSIIKGETVSFGYYHQAGIKFDNEQRVIDSIKDIAEVIQLKDNNIVTASQLLTLFHFPPDKQYDYIKNLSGGEKRRLQLLKVLMGNPNFLILDEPTNDLDLETLNTLEEYLEKFEGCIIIVSHDRYFMDRLVEHIFSFEGDGLIKDYPGNYTDYRETVVKLAPALKANTIAKSQKTKSKTKKLSFGEKRELEQIESDLGKLEKAKKELTDKLNSNEQDFEKLAQWGKELKVIEEKIDIREYRWLELNEDN